MAAKLTPPMIMNQFPNFSTNEILKYMSEILVFHNVCSEPYFQALMSHREGKDKNSFGQNIQKNTVQYRKKIVEERLKILTEQPTSKLFFCDSFGSSAAKIAVEKSNYAEWRMLSSGYENGNPYKLDDFHRQVSLLLSVLNYKLVYYVYLKLIILYFV